MNAEPCAADDEASRKRLHDLRAPLITMRGFGDELAAAVARLVNLVDAHQHQLPKDYVTKSRDVLKRDMIPCLGFLELSVGRLEGVLDDMSAGSGSDNER